MRPVKIVVDPPSFDDATGGRQAAEDVLEEAFVPEAPVGAFNEAVLLRLAGAM